LPRIGLPLTWIKKEISESSALHPERIDGDLVRGEARQPGAPLGPLASRAGNRGHTDREHGSGLVIRSRRSGGRGPLAGGSTAPASAQIAAACPSPPCNFSTSPPAQLSQWDLWRSPDTSVQAPPQASAAYGDCHVQPTDRPADLSREQPQGEGLRRELQSTFR
jgi:hypothetical protein